MEVSAVRSDVSERVLCGEVRVCQHRLRESVFCVFVTNEESLKLKVVPKCSSCRGACDGLKIVTIRVLDFTFFPENWWILWIFGQVS